MVDHLKKPEAQSELVGNGAALSEADLVLPDLQDAQLTWHQLEHYLDELLETGVRVALSGKSSSTARASDGLQLQGLLTKLRAGELRSAQLRYRYQAANWVDTLMLLPGGIRLVRMEMQT